jgi:hypothetical protein
MLEGLMVYRQAVEEADIDVKLKRELLHHADEQRLEMLQTIRETAKSALWRRQEAVKGTRRTPKQSLERFVTADSPAGQAVMSQRRQIARELELLKAGKERFTATVASAAPDARQGRALDALRVETRRLLSEPPPDDERSPAEYHMEVLLAARVQLRWELTDGQWRKLGAVLAEKDAANEVADKARQPQGEFKYQVAPGFRFQGPQTRPVQPTAPAGL